MRLPTFKRPRPRNHKLPSLLTKQKVRQRREVRASGGPYKGQLIPFYEYDNKTLIFRVGEWFGRYVINATGAYWEAS